MINLKSFDPPCLLSPVLHVESPLKSDLELRIYDYLDLPLVISDVVYEWVYGGVASLQAPPASGVSVPSSGT